MKKHVNIMILIIPVISMTIALCNLDYTALQWSNDENFNSYLMILLSLGMILFWGVVNVLVHSTKKRGWNLEKGAYISSIVILVLFFLLLITIFIIFLDENDSEGLPYTLIISCILGMLSMLMVIRKRRHNLLKE